MGRAETLAAARERFPQYNDMGDDALASALASNYPAYRDLVPAKQDNRSVVGGALADTFGLSDRPGRVGLTSNEPGAKTPLGVILKPANWQEQIVREMVLAPVTYAGGAGLGAIARGAGLAGKVAPAIGRIATSGGIGAATAAADDKSLLVHGGADTAFAAVAEGVGGLGGKALGKMTGGAEALDTIKNRLGRAGANGPLNLQYLDQAMRWWKEAATDAERSLRASDIARTLNGMAKGTGSLFKQWVDKAKVPLGVSQAAGAAKDVVKSGVPQAATEAAATAPVEPVGGLPAGVLGAMMLPGARPIAKHIPGAREVVEAVEEAE